MYIRKNWHCQTLRFLQSGGTILSLHLLKKFSWLIYKSGSGNFFQCVVMRIVCGNLSNAKETLALQKMFSMMLSLLFYSDIFSYIILSGFFPSPRKEITWRASLPYPRTPWTVKASIPCSSFCYANSTSTGFSLHIQSIRQVPQYWQLLGLDFSVPWIIQHVTVVGVHIVGNQQFLKILRYNNRQKIRYELAR